MMLADDDFTTAIAKGNNKAGEFHTRQQSRMTNLSGVKQISTGVNKMNFDTAGYKLLNYDELAIAMRNMFVTPGGKNAKPLEEPTTPEVLRGNPQPSS